MRISDWSADVCSSDLLAHFLGVGGAAKFLRAHDQNPGASAAAVLPSAASANRWVFYDRNGAPRSLAEVRQRFAEKLGDDSGALASAREADAQDIPADQQVQPEIGRAHV